MAHENLPFTEGYVTTWKSNPDTQNTQWHQAVANNGIHMAKPFTNRGVKLWVNSIR